MAGLDDVTDIAVHRSEDDDIAISLTVSGYKFEVTQTQVQQLGTAENIENVIVQAAGAEGITIPPIYVHINRDGSLSLALGEEPSTWREDVEE